MARPRGAGGDPSGGGRGDSGRSHESQERKDATQEARRRFLQAIEILEQNNAPDTEEQKMRVWIIRSLKSSKPAGMVKVESKDANGNTIIRLEGAPVDRMLAHLRAIAEEKKTLQNSANPDVDLDEQIKTIEASIEFIAQHSKKYTNRGVIPDWRIDYEAHLLLGKDDPRWGKEHDDSDGDYEDRKKIAKQDLENRIEMMNLEGEDTVQDLIREKRRNTIIRFAANQNAEDPTAEDEDAQEKVKQLEKLRKSIEKISISADEVQTGARKADALGLTGEERKNYIPILDHKEIQKNPQFQQILQRILDMALAEQSLMGNVQYHSKETTRGTTHNFRRAEEEINTMILTSFGKNSTFIPEGAQLKPEQCADLYEGAKRWVVEQALLQTLDTQQGQNLEHGKRPSKGKKLAGVVVQGVARMGIGIGAVALLGPFAGIVATGGLRMIDGLVRSKIEQGKINKWKRENYATAKGDLLHTLSFALADFAEYNIRKSASADSSSRYNQGYNDYYQRFIEVLKRESDAETDASKKLSEAEIRSRAVQLALYYEQDDRTKQIHHEAMAKRSPEGQAGMQLAERDIWNWARKHGLTTLEKGERNIWNWARRHGLTTLEKGKSWSFNSSPRDKFHAGMTVAGVTTGIGLARAIGRMPEVMKNIPWFGTAIAGGAGAYSGWKFGGAIADRRIGRVSPERETERLLTDLELRVQKFDVALATATGDELAGLAQPLLEQLSITQTQLEQLRNEHEYAKQIERWKKLYAKVISVKTYAEMEKASTLETAGAVGVALAKEFGDYAENEREHTKNLDARNVRTRMGWKIGGAVVGGALGALGYAYADDIKKWIHDLAPQKPDVVVIPSKGGGAPSALVGGGGEGGVAVVSESMVREGDGIENVLQRQLENSHVASRFGWNGSEPLDHFADRVSHQIADKVGYVEGMQEVRLGGSAIGHASYVLSGNAENPILTEYVDGKAVEQHLAGGVFEQPSDSPREYNFTKPQAHIHEVDDGTPQSHADSTVTHGSEAHATEATPTETTVAEAIPAETPHAGTTAAEAPAPKPTAAEAAAATPAETLPANYDKIKDIYIDQNATPTHDALVLEDFFSNTQNGPKLSDETILTLTTKLSSIPNRGDWHPTELVLNQNPHIGFMREVPHKTGGWFGIGKDDNWAPLLTKHQVKSVEEGGGKVYEVFTANHVNDTSIDQKTVPDMVLVQGDNSKEFIPWRVVGSNGQLRNLDDFPVSKPSATTSADIAVPVASPATSVPDVGVAVTSVVDAARQSAEMLPLKDAVNNIETWINSTYKPDTHDSMIINNVLVNLDTNTNMQPNYDSAYTMIKDTLENMRDGILNNSIEGSVPRQTAVLRALVDSHKTNPSLWTSHESEFGVIKKFFDALPVAGKK